MVLESSRKAAVFSSLQKEDSFWEDDIHINYRMDDEGYKNVENKNHRKIITDGVEYKPIIRQSEIDFKRFNPQILELDQLNSIVDEIRQRAEASGIKFYVQWAVNHKQCFFDKTNVVSSLCGCIDLALNICGETIYCSSKDYDDFRDKLELCFAEAQDIKGFRPDEKMNICHKRVLLSERVAAIMTHEVAGHLAEADLAFNNSEALYLFQSGQELGNKEINVFDDGSIDSTGWEPVDAEGIENKRTVIIEGGKAKGLLHNRYTAGVFGTESTGNARMVLEEGIPRVRMTNTVFEAGDCDLDNYFLDEDGFFFLESVSTCYGFNTIFVKPNRCYYCVGERRKPVRVPQFTISAMDFFKGICLVGNRVKGIESNITGCKKGSEYLLPVSMWAPRLFFEDFKINIV